MRTYGLASALCLSCYLAGCSSTESNSMDVGQVVSPEAGGGVPDAGLSDARGADAGLTVDVGLPPMDGGEAPDAGAAEDAGAVVRDPLAALLETWFTNYNEGQGQSYLEAQAFAYPEGDPDFEGLPPHRYLQGAAYGPYSRNLMDVWLPASEAPTPIAVFIHGGGFVGGSRRDIRENNSVPRLLNAGVAVATISYRWAYRNAAPALRAERPNDIGETQDQNGTRIDYILRDCARAVQFLRHRAGDWNLNPERVGAWGSSAGAGCSMWIASVPDLAQPDHADPVLRASSRLTVAGHNYGQVTYAFDRWADLLGFDPQWLARRLGGKQTAVTQMTTADFVGTEAGRQLARVLDYYEHLDALDPPFITTNQTEDLPQNRLNQGWQILHHVRGHYALYDRCRAVGGACAIKSRARNEGFEADLIAYLIEHLTAP